MSFLGLLNQTANIYTTGSYDAYGREVVGSATAVKCRFQKQSIRRLLPNGDMITIEGICYVPADTTIVTNDRITFGSDNYKVFGKYEAVDGTGDTHHLKLELIKW
jgi:hypothetical protein